MPIDKVIGMGMRVGHKQISNIIQTVIIECFRGTKGTVPFICPSLIRKVHGKECHKAFHRGRSRQLVGSNKPYAR